MRIDLETLNERIRDDQALDTCHDLQEMIDEEGADELFDTGSQTIIVKGKVYVLSLQITEEG